MEDLCIYVDYLKGGVAHSFTEEASPNFLDLQEKDCQAKFPVRVQGKAYLADGEVVVHLDVATQITMRCSICNEEVDVPINLSKVYLTATAEQLNHAVFDMKEPLREEILLALPNFVECHEGACPHRGEIDKFLKKGGGPEEHGRQRPFADL